MSIHRASLWTGYKRRRQLTLLAVDVLLIFGTALLALALRRWLFDGALLSRVRLLPVPNGVYALLLAYLVALYIFDQYNLKRDFSRRTAAGMLFLACVTGMIIATSIAFFARSLELGRFVTVLHLPLVFLALYAWRRYFFGQVLKHAQPHRVLLVISNDVEQGIEAELSGTPLGDYIVAGVFHVAAVQPGDGHRLQDGQGRLLEEVVKSERIDTLVLSVHGGLPPQYMEQAVDWKFDGVGVYDSANFYGAMTGRVPIETIDARWVLEHLNQPYGSAIVWRMKRVFDVLFALLLLIISLPFWPFLILAIRLDSPGPALFRQERVGLRQQPIVIAKFRSMFARFDEEGEAAYAQKEDPRVTRVGKFLRKTRLDELPQLWNVLTGEMSIVGLRPIRKINADRLAEQIPFYRLRFSMKPGLTGWPQIRYKYADDDVSHLHKFEYELYHIQNASIAFDLYLIVKTIQQMFFGRGQ